MNLARPLAVLSLVVASACDVLTPPAARSTVEYRPEVAGTVDNAMCLLGFEATALRRLATGHQLVQGSLNGRSANFVLDTGANLSVVHTAYAQQFGLVPQRGVFGAAAGLGGSLRASRSSITSLQLGELDIRQRHMMVADLSQIEQALGRLSDAPIHGVIGQDVMREHHAVIDIARPMLYLLEDGPTPTPVPAERCAPPPADEAPDSAGSRETAPGV